MKTNTFRPPGYRLDSLWIAYGLGHFGKSLFWHSSELLFAFYLTDVCGLTPYVMAAIIAVSLFASGLMDILAGHFLRKRIRSVAAAASMQMLGAVGSGTTFLLFLTTAFFAVSQRSILAFGFGLAFRLAYAFYDVPQNSILGLVDVNDRLRTGLSSLRFICSGLASLSIAVAAPILLTGGQKTGWFAVLGIGICIVGVGSSMWFLWISRRASLTSQTSPVDEMTSEGVVSVLPHSLHHVRQLLWIGFVLSASSAIFLKLEPYFAAYILKKNAARSMVMIAIACGGIVSQFFTSWIAVQWHIRPALRFSVLILVAGAIALMTLGAQNAYWASIAGFSVSFGLSGLGMLLWASVGNLAAKCAMHRESLSPTMIFGMLTFSQKTASALGTIIIGVILNLNGTFLISAGTFLPIILAMSIAPVVGVLICLFLASRAQPQIFSIRGSI